MQTIQLPCGVGKDGNIIYIEDAENGLKCDCVCPGCGQPLVAKNNGKKKEHHFAHFRTGECEHGYQSALHYMAKDIFLEMKEFTFVKNGAPVKYRIDDVVLEKPIDSVVPDILVTCDGKRFIVEIFVTHAVDDEKFAKIQHHRLTTFEINLSELVFETREEVKQAIYDVKNVRPIYDEQFTEKALTDKKHFIDTNGTIKTVHNGIVSECPMHIEVRWEYRRMKAMLSPVDSNLCRKCPFGYKIKNEDVVHCIGHLNIELSKSIFLAGLRRQNITVNLDYSCQINVSEQKVVSLAELAEFLTRVTKQKFSVIKSKKKSATRQRI